MPSGTRTHCCSSALAHRIDPWWCSAAQERVTRIAGEPVRCKLRAETRARRERMSEQAGRALISGVAGHSPMVDPEAFTAPTAVILGDVQIAAGASIWYH